MPTYIEGVLVGLGSTVEVSEIESLSKGSIIVGDGAGAPDTLTVGANDTIMVAASGGDHLVVVVPALRTELPQHHHPVLERKLVVGQGPDHLLDGLRRHDGPTRQGRDVARGSDSTTARRSAGVAEVGSRDEGRQEVAPG